jgi:hypothetical protein
MPNQLVFGEISLIRWILRLSGTRQVQKVEGDLTWHAGGTVGTGPDPLGLARPRRVIFMGNSWSVLKRVAV